MDPATEVGALISRAHHLTKVTGLHPQPACVEGAKRRRSAATGSTVAGAGVSGNFVEPTVFTDAPTTCRSSPRRSSGR
jgi:acyl-CoA reductase-like NAD-dependent aldehyde dehydrogenase